MTTKIVKNKEKIVSRILGIEDEQLNPSKYLRATAKKPVSAPVRKIASASAKAHTKVLLDRRNVSAPAKISVRARSKLNISKLPNELKSLIVNKYVNMLPKGYKLREWIPVEKLLWSPLCENPNAIEMIEERLKSDSLLSEEEYNELYHFGFEYKTVHWPTLSINKNAIELIKEKIKAEDLLTPQEYERLRNNNRLDWAAIAINEDYDAMKLLDMKRSKIEWYMLSQQKNAMKLFIIPKYNEEKSIDKNILFNMRGTEKLDWGQLSRNEDAIKIIKEHLRFEDTIPLEIYNYLDSSNKINWGELAENPNAMQIIINFIEKYIQYENIHDEDDPNYRYAQHFDQIWRNLSKNPNASKYLYEKYPKKIKWRAFSGNPKAIKYLNMPINYDNIDWCNLSKNPAAINLLIANREKIDWCSFSCNTNPKAMELIKEKFEDELLDTENNTFHLLRPHEKLDWHNLSKNPAIFEEI
jgi:hypothetical protein